MKIPTDKHIITARLDMASERPAFGNLAEPAAEWLAEQFACEYCAECGGDQRHHTAVPFNGNWFARCDWAPDDDGVPHPNVQKDRIADGTAYVE